MVQVLQQVLLQQVEHFNNTNLAKTLVACLNEMSH